QAGFFSPGSLPPALEVTRTMKPEEIAHAALARTPFGAPAVRGLFGAPGGDVRYAAGPGIAPVAAYTVSRRGELDVALDERVERAYLHALLPQAARATRALIDFVFRASVDVATNGDVAVHGASLARGELTCFAEDAAGRRRVLERTPIAG